MRVTGGEVKNSAYVRVLTGAVVSVCRKLQVSGKKKTYIWGGLCEL